MRQGLILLFVLAIQVSAEAQDILPSFYDTLERKQSISINGTGELNSTAISNRLTTYFIRGGQIPDETTAATIANHKSLNRIGFSVVPELEYSVHSIKPFKGKNWGIQFNAGMILTGAGRYSEGLFGLAFKGNEQYLGQEVDFSNSVFGLFGAHKIGFGMIDNISKSSVSINIYGITNYAAGYITEGSFYQDTTGFDAEVMLNGQVETTLGSTYYKGIGVGVDANFYFKTRTFKHDSYIQFKIQNLGAGFMTADISRYSMDTTLNFNGFVVSDFVGDSTIFNDNTKLRDEIGLKEDTIRTRTIALPFSVQIGKIVDEHNTNLVQGFGGIKVYAQNGSIPMVFGGAQFRPTDWLRIGASVSYGGFTGFRGGIYLSAVTKKFNIGLATNNVVGLVSKSGYGYAYQFRLNYRF